MPYFERKAYQRLLDWKERSRGSRALLVEGARRVGKTTLVEEFGRREYETCLVIDFLTATRHLRQLFDEYIGDLDRFFQYLEAETEVHLVPRRSLIVFDEVQAFPPARQAIKYLVADGRYDYLETGSLISIRKNVRDITIPSEERAMRLDPMDFDEFLWAIGERPLATLLAQSFAEGEFLPEGLTRKASGLFREYMLVGGMPQAVAKFVQSKDFDEVEEIKRDILALYRNDVEKHTGRDYPRVQSVLNSIPSQLSRKNKRFQFNAAGSGTRAGDLASAFFWLEDAFLVNRSLRCTDPSLDLASSADPSSFKCYLADTGLLVSLAFPDASIAGGGVMRDVLEGKLSVNEGMLTENLVAQCLRASGRPLYYWSSYDECSRRSFEVDFLLPEPYGSSGRPRVSPVEVKSAKRYGTASLDEIERRYGNRKVLGKSYVLAPKAPKAEGARLTLPLFYASRI